MHSPELEPLSDREKSSPNSTNNSTGSMQSDIIKKIKSKTKKNKDENLHQSLINPNEQTIDASQHQIIEIDADENDDTNHNITTTTKLINDDDASQSLTINQYNNNYDNNNNNIEQEYKYQYNEAYLDEQNKSFCSRLSSTFCSCYQKGTVSKDFEGNNLICCNRHLITGPLSQFSTVSLTVILISLPLYGYYWIIHKIWWQQAGNIAAYLIIMFISIPMTFSSFYFLFKTNFTDPGIIPRCTKDQPMFGPLNEFDRFCSTCHVIRGSKAKHCSICDNCVNGFDHHCMLHIYHIYYIILNMIRIFA